MLTLAKHSNSLLAKATESPMPEANNMLAARYPRFLSRFQSHLPCGTTYDGSPTISLDRCTRTPLLESVVCVQNVLGRAALERFRPS